MLFCPKNRDDISKYYRGTFAKLREFGDQLFFFENVDTNSVRGQHESGERFAIYLNDDTPYEVEYILPRKSFFQMGADAVLLQRKPDRQYSRGLCQTNTSLTFLDAAGKFAAKPLDFTTLRQYVNKPAFPSLNAVADDAAFTTVALSPRMMYRRTNRNIYVDFTVVARVNTSKKTVFVTNDLFTDELKALIMKSGDSLTWSVEPYVPPPPRERTKTEDLLKEMGMKKKPLEQF